MSKKLPQSRPAALGDVFYRVLRRMRFPFILIIAVYTFCTVGLALIPGTDPVTGQQAPPLSMFDAFYVVSFTAATIGFGEVPVPFNAAQRMWMTFTIYFSVAAWTYSLVNVLALLQDRAFQNAVRVARFSHLIYGMREPFYIVCGVGETGRIMCHGLDHLGLRFVAIEKDAPKLQQMRFEPFGRDNPMIAADASHPTVIARAGLHSPYCRGVVALTDDDATNEAIAVSARLLAPRVPVLTRIRDTETETHIGVFGGDIVINPFARFAERLGAAIATPERYRLRELLTGLPGAPVRQIQRPPRGTWIICGYGRFGHAIAEELEEAGMKVVTIDDHEDPGEKIDVFGTGTKSDELKAAGIDEAVGIVNGHASDARNLSIAVTARAMKRDLFIVNRQNHVSSTPLFQAFDSDLDMQPSRIVAQEFIARITTPLLNRFLRLIPQHNEADCAKIYERLSNLDPGRNPEVWHVSLSEASTPAAARILERGEQFTVGHLLANPFRRDLRMRLVVLLIRRGNTSIQLPDENEVLQSGDKLLLAGNPRAKRRLMMMLANDNLMRYIMTGHESNGGFIWRWLTRKRVVDPVPLPPPILEAADPSDDGDPSTESIEAMGDEPVALQIDIDNGQPPMEDEDESD